MTRYVACDTWGLCDFRRMLGPFDCKSHAMQAAQYALETPHEPFLNQWTKREVDPGDDIQVGDWLAAQDGMISGPYFSKRDAKSSLAENLREDYADPPGYVVRVIKVVHRYRGNRGATTVVAQVY